MCSNASSSRQAKAAAADVAARLAQAIDEYAAAADHLGSDGKAPEPDLSGRLAALWGMLTDADPELADLAARYARSERES